jgi:hypothetical protein
VDPEPFPPGLGDCLTFPLVEALVGRRSRRFGLGFSIPDGPFAYTSRHAPLPLTELEQLVLLSAAAGNTGWHFLHPHSVRSAPHLPSYAAAASGRTFPSIAGWHSTELFFTDDAGVYHFATRAGPALVEPTADGTIDPTHFLAVHRRCIRRLAEGRLNLPAETCVSPHNAWCANQSGSTVLIPVSSAARQLIALLCVAVQRGKAIVDDVHGAPLGDPTLCDAFQTGDEPWPLSVLEQEVLAGVAADQAMICFAGTLVLQAMGLGGWVYNGLDGLAVLGGSDDPAVPGLRFHVTRDDRWPVPNPTGRSDLFPGHCPPHFPDMRAAVEAFVAEQFGPGGPFDPATPGPWRESAAVRGGARPYDEAFVACVASIAQQIHDRFGKFPGTVPSMLATVYLQAHHLDLEFYDEHFAPGAYLPTHAEHMAQWHQTG